MEDKIGKSQQSQERKFDIVSPQETDSLGGPKWREYLENDKLLQAWSLPENSPYLKYQKTKTLRTINELASQIMPRYSDGERNSEKGLNNLIGSDLLGKETAVILDSGGAHSVAMAVKLVKHGYQPVVMFDNIPHTKGANRSEQSLATLLYFAEETNNLKRDGRISSKAPPVFILDTHRDDMVRDGSNDNTYRYAQGDFPSAEEFKKLGIKSMIYLNEGDQNGRVNQPYQSPDRLGSDLKEIAGAWEEDGLKIIYTGISPWKSTRSAFESIGENMSGWRDFDFESRLSYPDMEPEVYGEGNGIAMHTNRERFLFTKEGELVVINEQGSARDMSDEEVQHFKSEIEKQIKEQSENEELRSLYQKL